MNVILKVHLNNHLFLALATAQAGAVTRAWANFLRNHDELSLSLLTDTERNQVFSAVDPHARARADGRGLRCLAPMLRGDRRRQTQATSLLLRLPGLPVLNDGEEIGLGGRLDLPYRESVRTPMQWTAEAGAGFSAAPPDAFARPLVQTGPFQPEHVNAAQQAQDPTSLLAFARRALAARKASPELTWGDVGFLPADHPAVLILHAHLNGRVTYAVHNLSNHAAPVTRPGQGPLTAVLSSAAAPPRPKRRALP